jgi:nucleotide-binding universal stress UspA family protein
MKNVLLLVHDDVGQDARLQAALDLTRALNGHLTCLNVAAMPIVSGELYGLAIESQVIADERDRSAENRKAIEPRLIREDVSWDWTDVTGDFAFELKDAAKTADIIVLNRKLDSTTSPDMLSITSEVVIGSGKTVVAVPEDASGFQVAGRALIAWDGSDEAMKAVQAAVPLLALASGVTILEVRVASIKLPAQEAATYLSRHGIEARIIRQEPDVLYVVDALLAKAKSGGAGYIVMGGFGHSRLLEAIFGGASREMLTDSPMPIVMTH